jgi:Tfp pilus assembly protein PilN
VLALRAEGLSFAAIANRLGFRRSRDALDAFHRALRSSAEADRPRLIHEELARLEALEARIRSGETDDPEKMQNRLHALGRMRERLLPAPGG